MKPTRRDVLKGFALAGVGAAVLPGCGAIPERQPWPEARWEPSGSPDAEVFPLGAQAGEPGPDRLYAVAKVVAEGTVTLHYALFVDGQWQAQEPVEAQRDEHGPFVRAWVRDLPSDTSVALYFSVEGGARSPVVSARTCMAEGQAGSIRLLLNCCDHRSGRPLLALSNALAFPEVDAHIHLGDAAYCDGSLTVEEFGEIWQSTLELQGYQDLFSHCAGIYTWDDHEVDNNWEFEELDPQLIENARIAMHQHVPLPRDAEHPDRLWRSLRFGDVAELFMLDCRGERDRPNGRYISEEQLQWLLDGLSRSTATWKLIGNSVPMSSLPGPYQAPIAINDTWHGHGDGEQRRRLVEHITSNGLEGVLVLSGDYHMPALSRLDPEGPGFGLWEVISGPGGSAPNPIGLLMDPDDQIVYLDAARNIMVLDFHSDGTARIQMVDEDQRVRLDATLDVYGELLAFESHRVADDPPEP
ncbi:MAG: hypothetical protein EA397_12875 [Deltaproteobacteria bacterium]|nr:MAG: hypothetical protein EA397_12875 [Deltaproteobacteria bacterium]